MIKRKTGLPVSSPPLFHTGSFYALCAIAGTIAAFGVFILLNYGDFQARRNQVKDLSLQSIASVEGALNYTWDRAEFWVDQVAWQLGAAERERIPTLIAQHQRLWPDAAFSLFDSKGNLITDLTSGQTDLQKGNSIAEVPSLTNMVVKALDGERARDYTVTQGALSLGVAVPVQGMRVRVLVISVPLDSRYLNTIKELAAADLALAILDESGKAVIGGIAKSDGAFKQNDKDSAARIKELNTLLRQSRITVNSPFLVQDETFLGGLKLLVSPEYASPRGVLIALPSQAASTAYHIWHVYAALVFGLFIAMLTGIFLRFRERRMANAVAADMYGLTRDLEAGPQNAWPPALDRAFRKIAENLEEHRVLMENAVVERSERHSREQLPEEVIASCNDAELKRFFDALPVGAFKATGNGHLLKVNRAFALMLGYESPTNLLAECDAFTSLCIYAEGLRTPLSVLAKKSSGRHLLSLRRSNGQVRQFALLCAPVTSETGEDEDVIEGFLLDRELEEKLAAVEKDNLESLRERESLARLLAATCLQTKSYFQPPRPKNHSQKDVGTTGQQENEHATESTKDADRQYTTAANAETNKPLSVTWPEFKFIAGNLDGSSIPERIPEDDDERLERRKSMLSIKSILNDIHQIATTEVEGASPTVTPLEFLLFLKQLCRQALPSLFSRGISLRCEIADDLPLSMSGPTYMLRHALLRALLAVTAPAEGGWACLSVMHDPASSDTGDSSLLLFSISWTPDGETPEDSFTYEGRNNAMHSADEGFTIFVAETEENMRHSQPKPAPDSFDMTTEQDVIRYLSRKMQGVLKESAFTKKLRSMQIVAPLDRLGETGIDGRTISSGKSAFGPVDLNSELARPTAAPRGLPQEEVEIKLIRPETPTRSGIQGIDALSVDEIPGLSAKANAAEMEDVSGPHSLNLLVIDPDLADQQNADVDVLQRDEILEDEHHDDTPSLNILLIDSSLNSRMLFSMYLRDTNHRITEAHDGQTGLEAFQRGSYDVIFMDMEMPLMDGYQATRIIRALETERGQTPTPIVGITTYALPELRRECMLAGCTEFLSRPFGKNALLAMLRAIAGLRKNIL